MEVLFLVTAYQYPRLLARLCTCLLEAPDASIAVQWDRSRPIQLDQLPSRVALHQTREPVGWGTGSQLVALLDSLNAIAARRFDWMLVLTGEDYPIRPLPELLELLASTQYELFLQTPPGSVVTPPERHGELSYLQERYFYRYLWGPRRLWSAMPPSLRRVVEAGAQRGVHRLLPGNLVRVQRRTRGLPPGIGARVRHHPFTDTRVCRKGADWFALSRRVFDDLVMRIASQRDLVQYFRRTYIPTESFFHTLLLPEWEGANAGDNLHYRRFSGGPHPELLGADDFSALSDSGKFFARKFDESSDELLGRIDRQLLRRG